MRSRTSDEARPVDFNKNENRYNWELVYCELYAGGKYNSNDDNYAYSLGLNGLGLCATQFASAYMDVEIFRDGYQYNLHFEKGVNVGGLQKKTDKEKTNRNTDTLAARPGRIYRDRNFRRLFL